MMNTIESLLDERQAAEILGLSVRFLQNRRYVGGGPPFVKISARAVRYRPSDLERWVEEHIQSSTAEGAA
jgi:predicted DNA-binding transcriptional regulator AlpA